MNTPARLIFAAGEQIAGMARFALAAEAVAGDVAATSERQQASMRVGSPFTAGGSLTPIGQRGERNTVASTPYPMRANSSTLSFFERTTARLENAARQDSRFQMPAMPAGAPGWRTSTLHSVMGEGASVLVPPDATPPDGSVVRMDHQTLAAFDHYLSSRPDAFRYLTDEAREWARSAVVVLLDNLKQPAATSGRLEASEIPAALRLIDDAAKKMSGHDAASTPSVATARAELPSRTLREQRSFLLRAGIVMEGLNARPGNAPGLLDRNSWRDIVAIEEPALRQQVVRQAFDQYRAVLRQAYDSNDWSAVANAVLQTTDQIALLAGERPQVFADAVSRQEWLQVVWQQRLMGFVRFHQSQIDHGPRGDGRPLSDWQRAELHAAVRNERTEVLRGNRGLYQATAEGMQMTSQAVRQLDRLLEQLRRGGR